MFANANAANTAALIGMQNRAIMKRTIFGDMAYPLGTHNTHSNHAGARTVNKTVGASGQGWPVAQTHGDRYQLLV